MTNKFDKYFEELDRKKAGQVATQVQQSPVSPDEAAAHHQTATELKLPAAVVGSDPGFFRAALEQRKARETLEKSPKTSWWLGDQQNGALAKDDLDNLSWYEAIGNALVRGGKSMVQGFHQTQAMGHQGRYRDSTKDFSEIVTEEANWRPRSGVVNGTLDVMGRLTGAGPLMRSTQRYAASRMASDPQQAAVVSQANAARVAQEIAAIPMTPGAAAARDRVAAFKPSGSFAKDLEAVGDMIVADPVGFVSFLGQVVVESSPSMGAGAVAALVTRSPAVAAAVMGITSGATEYGNEASDFVQKWAAENKVDLTTREGALMALSNEELMRTAQERGELRGLIIGSLDTLSGGIAGKALSNSKVANLLLQTVVQGAFGAGGEAVAQLATDGQINLAEVVIEGLAEFAMAPVEVAVMSGKRFPGLVSRFTGGNRTKDALGKIDEQAAASKLKARAPDKFLDALNAQGLDEAQIFIPPAAVEEFFQGMGFPPDLDVLDSWGISGEAWDRAQLTGEDLAVPVSVYAARISGTDAAPLFLERGSLNPDAEMSSAEAAEFNSRWREIMEEELGAIEERRVSELQERADEEIIADELTQQLAPNMTPDAARHSAAPVVNFISTMAKRTGQKPLDLWRRYQVQIAGSVQAEQVRRRGVIDMGLNELRAVGRPAGPSIEQEAAAAEKAAREKFPELRLARPFTRAIGERGGIEPGSPAAVELAARGVTPKTAPGLFRKGGSTDLDNIPAGEIFSGPVLAEDGNGYLSRDAVIEAIEREQRGEKVPYSPDALAELQRIGEMLSQPDASSPRPGAYVNAPGLSPEGQRLAAVLDELGLDISTMDNDAVAAALGEADMRGTSFATGEAASMPDPDGIEYEQFAGKFSETADKFALGRAEEMLAEGFSPELVRKETGWFKGADGKWRYEISDDEASLLLPAFAQEDLEGFPSLRDFSAGVNLDPVSWGGFRATHPDFKDMDGWGADEERAIERLWSDLRRVHLAQSGAKSGIMQRPDMDQMPLSELLHHPKLFAAYPDLGAVSVYFEKETPGYRGQASVNGDWIKMQVTEDVEQFTSTLLHEIQHLIQVREDFAMGGSASADWTNQLKGAMRQITREAQRAVSNWKFENINLQQDAEFYRHMLSAAGMYADYERLISYANHERPSSVFRHIRNISGWLYSSKIQKDEDLRERARDIQRQFYALPRSGPKRNAALRDLSMDLAQIIRASMGTDFDMVKADGRAAKSLVKAMERRVDKIREKEAPLRELERKLNRAEEAELATERKSAFEVYQSIYGEIEARNTQARRSMTDDQRRDAAPEVTQDVRNAEAIVYFRNGQVIPSASLASRMEGSREMFQNGPDRTRTTRGSTDARGSIRIPAAGIGSGPTIISLFDSQNLSTFLHESGHLFLEIYQDLSSSPDAAPELIDGMAAIRKWLGVKDGEKIQTKHHEKWARGFEAYLMEGKAPSLELQDSFSRFKGWLMRIYESFASLHVKLSPEIRTVMDRMLATDEAIAEARAAHETAPLFADRGPAGMSESDWAAYQKLAQRSQDEGDKALLKRTMERVRREKTKWWKEELEATQKQVEAELGSRPIFKLVSVLGNKRWLSGSKAPVPDLRLDKAALVEMMGDGVLAELDRAKLGTKRAIYGAGGTHPEVMATMFGFGSVSEMMDQLQNTPRYKDAVSAEVDRRMTEAHGDPLNDGSIEEEAIAALHNETEGEKKVAELRALGRRLGKTEPRSREYKLRARAMIGAMSVRDASRYNAFLRAERKAAAEAQAAFAGVVKGGRDSIENLEKAYAAKEREVLNHHLYREGREAAQMVDRARRRFRSYNSPRVRAAIGSPHIERIDDLLGTYEFKNRSDKWLSNREAMRQYIDMMTEEGRENELAIDPAIAAQDGRNHYSRMSVSELQGLVDTVKNIEHIGRRFGKVEQDRKLREEAEVLKEIEDAFAANIKARAPSRVAEDGEARRKLGRDILNWTLNADTLLREIDGRADMGVAWSAIKKPIDEGMNRLQARKVEVAKAFDQIFSAYSDKEKRAMATRKPNAHLGVDMSKWSLLALALNTGNADNFQRLTNPNVSGSFEPSQIEAALGELTERDWRFVQSMWDYVNTFWPDISAKETRVTGVSPKKVEAQLMTSAAPSFVTGGYYPIKYDSRLSPRADDLSQQALSDMLKGGRISKAQTAKGHTVERLASSTQPVLLDIGVAFSHVNDVIYDLELNEAVANSFRLLSKLKDTFFGFGRHSDHAALESWVKDVAAGERTSAHGWGKVMQLARTGFTFSRLAMNLGTVLLQPTGISQSVVVVGKAAMARGVVKFASAPHRWGRDIAAASPFMAERQKTFQRDLHNIMGDLDRSGMTGGRWSNFQRKMLVPLSFYLMQKVQFYTVDGPTWLGAYDKAVKEGRSESDARTFADLMVKRSQGSGLISDRGMLERGKFTPRQEMNEMPKLLTALGSYMFQKFNVAYERTMGTSWRSPVEVMSWAADMAMLFAFEAVLAAVVKSKLPDDDEDEAVWLAKETGLSFLGTIPIVRDAASALQGFSGGGAGASAIDLGVIRPLMEAADLFTEDGEFDRGTLTAMIDGFGVWLHLPSSQTNRMIKAFFDEDLSPQEVTIPGALGLGGGNKGRSLIEYLEGL